MTRRFDAPDLTAPGERHAGWLHDRGAHRAPVDEHFAEAMEWLAVLTAKWRFDGVNRRVLELGPAAEMDLRAAVEAIPGGVWAGVDVGRAVHPDCQDVSAEWDRDRALPLPPDHYTLVLSREVFEHVYHVREMLAECRRVLAPGGRLYFSTPFIFPLHDYEPELGGDFWRFSPAAWGRLLTDAGFEIVTVTGARHLFGSWQTPVSILGYAGKSSENRLETP